MKRAIVVITIIVSFLIVTPREISPQSFLFTSHINSFVSALDNLVDAFNDLNFDLKLGTNFQIASDFDDISSAARRLSWAASDLAMDFRFAK